MPTYLSQNAIDELKIELEKRKKETRPAIVEQISDAKELGDLSENFEYHDAKERQGLNEGRIMQIEAMLHDAVIVEATAGGTEIGLGATFKVKFGDNEKTFSLVGSSEADPIAGKISHESPIGAAFMGKKPGDEVAVEVPSGTIVYNILEIE